MQTEIGEYDPATRSVPVKFTRGELVHTRSVNACLDDHGDYDRGATATRVADVAMGVAAKIAVGAITMPVEIEAPAEPEATPETADDGKPTA